MAQQPPSTEAPVRQPATTSATSRQGIVWTPRLVIWTVILIVVLFFVIANFETVSLGYLFGETDAPLAVWLLVFLVIGYVLGWLRPHFRSRTR